eukprot:Opistho-2@25192
MAIKVYGMAMSTCTRRVITALEEKGLAYELEIVDLMKGAHKQPDFLKLQPFGQIPVLEDDGYRVYESRAIVHYLESKYPNKGTNLLHLEDPKKFGQIEQWLNVEVSHYNPYTSGIVSELMFKPIFAPGAPIDQEKVQGLRNSLNASLDVYERHLAAGNEYLANNEFSFADLSHLPYGLYLVKAGHGDAFESRPHVKAWWDRITARASWVKASA